MSNKDNYIRKTERTKVDFPLWRKKVDKSIFKEKSTPIPDWVSQIWNLNLYFQNITSIKEDKSKVLIKFEDNTYDGNVVLKKRGQKKPIYRLFFSDSLANELKNVFLMSHMRGIEQELNKDVKVENEIPFWEFLDIEFNESENLFLFTAYYRQKPTFPELFINLVNSPALAKVEDKVLKKNKKPAIYKSDWLPRSELDSKIGATNVIYMLANSSNNTLYIGETKDLVKRLNSRYKSIPKWDFFRYDLLPIELAPYRVTIERMLIRQFASIMGNTKDIETLNTQTYRLVNRKVDS
jgi:hypothetical protein